MDYRLLENIDSKRLGARLQDARRSAALTQETAATQLGMARTTVVAIEKGERRLSPHELIQFAKAYRRPVSDLVGRPVVSESFAPQFRAVPNKSEPDSEVDPIATKLQNLAEDYVALERIRSMPLAQSYPNEYDTAGGSPEQVAEDVATAERNRLGMGDGPIGNLRERLASDVGIRIFFFDMPSRIAGLFAYNEELGACIGINSKHPRDRRNWSLAHEYGHFLMTRYQPEVTVLTLSGRSNKKERLVDSFARYFLMPATGLNRRFTELHRSAEGGITLAHVCTLANLYQVSVQALILRLEELRRLPTGTWDRLKVEGFKVQHAQALLGIDANPSLTETLPQRYVDLAVAAYQAEQISEGQLAKYLRTGRLQAREFVEASEGRIHSEDDGAFRSVTPDLAQALGGR